MKKLVILSAVFAFLFYLTSFNCNAQTPNWCWARGADCLGTGGTEGNCIATDAYDNVYITGYFSSEAIIFGSTTITNIYTFGNICDLFLAKYDANGNVIWAKSAGGKGYDYAYSVSVDSLGNVYVAGGFKSDTLFFGSITLINHSNEGDIFLAKYDANGNVLWAKSAGGTLDDEAYSVATDGSGNAYVAGYFNSDTLIFGSTTLTNNGIDMFLAKYDANGNVLWAKCAGHIQDDYATYVAVDASRNAYVAGNFDSDTITFGSITLTDILIGGSHCDFFLAKYDTNGNVLWAKNALGNSSANSVAVDVSGNSYLTGNFYGDSIIIGSTTLTSAGSFDVFLAKYDANGNALWAKSGGGTSSDGGWSVAVDALGNSYITGAFNSPSISFDSISLTQPIYSNDPMFLVKYNTSGNVIYGLALSSGGDDFSSVSVTPQGSVYIGGDFMSNPFIVGSDTLIPPCIEEAFVAKLCNIIEVIKELSNSSNTSLYPNPATDNITIDVSATLNIPAIIEITNIEGQVIEQQTTNFKTTNLDVSALAKGMYFVKVRTEKGVESRKFVKL